MKTADKFDAWIYLNFPVLLAIVEIFQVFLVKAFPILRKFFEKMDDRPGLNEIIPQAERRRREQDAINNLFAFSKKVKTKKAIKIIANTDGYVSFGRQIATEAAESNAPPAGPPDPVFSAYSTLSALLPCIFIDLIDHAATDKQYYRHLRRPEIQKYIIQKITQKCINRPDLISLNINNINTYRAFDAAVKGEIDRQLLNILAAPEPDDDTATRQAPIIIAARRALYRKEYSMDAPLPSNDGGKMATLHDITPSSTPDPLSILIGREQAQAEQAAIDALSHADKAQIIAEYDARDRARKGLLFDVQPDADPADEPIPTTIRQPYAARRKGENESGSAPAGQLCLFMQGGAI